MLGMLGICSYWNKLGKKPVEPLEGCMITLLEQLHRKRLAGSSLVIEEATISNYPSQSESNMDSAVNPYGIDTDVLVVPSLTKKIVKMEHVRKKPPSFSTKVVLKGPSSKRKEGVEKILSLERVVSQPDKPIDLTSPKRQRTARRGAVKSHGLSSLNT
ncbi:unnamed protein product [Lactuca saligna]|uniref:Uncharacterized protein n=1 Tax=Lactuca saligna TaxID=75948 RepID=A0AA36EIE3_LACSI|nr:unnamed protein product [Lactuca saligna]